MVIDREKNRLFAEQVGQLYRQAPVGIVATLVNSCVLIFILRNIVAQAVLVKWFSALMFITFLRCVALYGYRRCSPAPAQAGRWNTWFVVGMGFSGVIWGSAGIFLFPVNSIVHQVFVAFVLGGMVAGAAGALAVTMAAFLAYCLPAFLPVIIRFFAIGDEIHLAMGTMALLFGLLMFSTAKRLNTIVKRLFRLKFENIDLITYLEEAKERVEKSNEKLTSEIVERKKTEVELKKHREHLEDRVNERTAELTQANAQLRIEIAERKNAEAALKRRMVYEKMLAEISTQSALIEDISEFQEKCLKIMEQLLDFGRIYIFEHHPETDTIRNTFESITDGLDSLKENLQEIPASSIPWLVEKMKSNQTINYADTEDIPGEQEKDMLRAQNIKSILIVPLFVEKSYYGFIGFSECRFHRDWIDEDIRMLNVTAQIITRVIEVRRAEEARRDSEEKYRHLVENANDAIFIVQDMHIKFHNQKMEELTGYTPQELAELPFMDLVHSEDRDRVPGSYPRGIKGEETAGTYSLRLINKVGEELLGQVSTVSTTWEGKPAALAFFRDLTQQKKLEDQLRQAQKMESIGTLAGGVAHDFNNLLMGIQGNASLMLFDMDSRHPYYEKLKNIEQYVQSGANLVQQLLGFARVGKYKVTSTDLNEMIKKSSQLFERTTKEVKIYRKYQRDIWTVTADRSQIEQVLLNLYVNAWQAMPGGGNIYLEAANVTLDESQNRPFQAEPGDYVKISVTDTGEGMDAATKARVFEPFFTTKAMGRGTGLGLASAYGIIKNHGGMIHVDSEKNKGTTFTIYLPASKKKVLKEKRLVEDLLRGKETILLVDDEDMIIDVGTQLLERIGYKVLSAKNGKEALEIYREKQDKIDMVILDIMMPGMDGGETYDRLKEINPDIKVFLSSGYSLNGRAKAILKRGCNDFIQKPFNIKQLSQKIRKVLGKNES